MSRINKKRLLNILQEFATIYKYDTYRHMAYINAINNMKPLRILTLENTKELVGDRIYSKIVEYVKTGCVEELTKLKKYPQYKILGYNANIYQKHSLYGKKLDDVIKILSGLPHTHLQSIGLKYAHDLEQQIPRDEATEILRLFEKFISDVQCLGSYRRGNAFVNDLDLITTQKITIDTIKDNLGKKMIDVIMHGSKKITLLVKIKKVVRQVDINFVKKEELIPAILHGTGPKEHNLYMRRIAKEKGYKLNQYGLFMNDKLIPIKSEKDIYDALGIPRGSAQTLSPSAKRVFRFAP